MSLKSAAQARQNREQKDLAMGNRAAPSRTLRNTAGTNTFTGNSGEIYLELKDIEVVVATLQTATYNEATITWAPGSDPSTIILYAWDNTGAAAAVATTVSWIAHGN